MTSSEQFVTYYINHLVIYCDFVTTFIQFYSIQKTLFVPGGAIKGTKGTKPYKSAPHELTGRPVILNILSNQFLISSLLEAWIAGRAVRSHLVLFFLFF